MARHTQVAVIAPEQLIGAFNVLIHSESSLNLLATATSTEFLLTSLADQIPEVILIYLAHECKANEDQTAYEKISQIKSFWPDTTGIAIVKYASQLNQALESGADLALVEGVNAERLINALKGDWRNKLVRNT